MCVSQLYLSSIDQAKPCIPFPYTDEDGCRCLILQRPHCHPPPMQGSYCCLQEKQQIERCYAVQVSKDTHMLIPSASLEEAVGTGPCFHLSPSSELTKAKEEFFRALSDMFSSYTHTQGRISKQTCPEAPSGQ